MYGIFCESYVTFFLIFYAVASTPGTQPEEIPVYLLEFAFAAQRRGLSSRLLEMVNRRLIKRRKSDAECNVLNKRTLKYCI